MCEAEQNKELANDNFPRERLEKYGEKALSYQELLAIILRTGYKEKHVMELSLHILYYFDSLFDLKMAPLEELQKIKGIGRVKAIEIKAAIELGLRLAKATQIKYGKITSSKEIGALMLEELGELKQEHLVAVYLNTKNEVLKKETIFIGSLNQSIAHPREIFKGAVKYSAARIILAHNHPSGNPTPSRNDKIFTKRIMECGDLMGIDVLDHFVIGENEYISLREVGVVY